MSKEENIKKRGENVKKKNFEQDEGVKEVCMLVQIFF